MRSAIYVDIRYTVRAAWEVSVHLARSRSSCPPRAAAAPAAPGPSARAVELLDDGGGRTGAASERVVVDDADLVLLVTGEQHGQVGACGCEGRPLGGLARQQAYVEAVEATQAPMLVLNTGGWLDARAMGMELTERARVANEGFLRALRRVRVDVLNVGWSEWAALDGRARPGLVSSGLHHDPTPVLDVVVREVGGRRVAVTGMTRPGFPYLMPEGTRVGSGVASVQQALATVAYDVAVVMVYDDPSGARAVSMLPEVDVVLDAAQHRGRFEPLTDGALHVRTWEEGQRLSELRLWLSEEGIERAMVRWVDLDARIGTAWRPPGPPTLPMYVIPDVGAEPADTGAGVP